MWVQGRLISLEPDPVCIMEEQDVRTQIQRYLSGLGCVALYRTFAELGSV